MANADNNKESIDKPSQENNVISWDEDKLDRKESADFLTNYLTKRYTLAYSRKQPDNTFVLNVRAEWGFGKTFFLKRWAKDLQHSDYPVVFYDAWANDFSDDPLIGFIAEINAALSSQFEKIPLAKRHLDQALSVGRKLIKPIGLGLAAIFAKKLSGYTLEELNEFWSQTSQEETNTEADDKEEGTGKKIASLISSSAEAVLKEHIGKKETIATFKKRLETLTESLQKEAGVQLPIFIFIDELDRCRPTYAIELLEAVKHLFGVKGVYFVVATNLEQLGHSIRAVYGEQFDSERYLKRFFDQEYLLPTPDGAKFTEFLFERYALNGLANFYTVIEDEIYKPTPAAQALFTILCDSFELGPRDQEQVAALLQAVLLSWPKKERVHLAYLLFLIIAKHVSTKLFQQLAENRPLQEFRSMISEKIRPGAVFQCYELASPNGWGMYVPKNQHILDLLIEYQRVQQLTGDELMQEINKRDYSADKFPDKIINALLRDGFSVDTPLKIADYSRRVSQAGQLLVSSDSSGNARQSNV